MDDPRVLADRRLDALLARIERTPDRLVHEVTTAGLDRHGQIVNWAKSTYDLGHGDANLLAHAIRRHRDGGPAPDAELLDTQYAGKKARLRPIHDRIVAFAAGLGDDVTVVVQKTGVSLRRRKQFALVQAPSAKRVALGLNLPTSVSDLRAAPTTGMCSHCADLHDLGEVDDHIEQLLRLAYDHAG
ncbi:MAG: DUF5655 domain-containing protein [Acidimicrobiia bacterium]